MLVVNSRTREESESNPGVCGKERSDVYRSASRIGVCAVLVVGALGLAATPAYAAVSTVVSLTFDNNTISQFTLAYQQALVPHNMDATFYVNSGTVGASKNFMSWSQLSTLASAGNEIGGKTVDGKVNLKTNPDYQTKVDEVCNDRAALVAHGFSPATFAYPFGGYDATAQSIVKNCGYGNARAAGGISPTGALYAETLPPVNWFATRPYGPSGQVSLANLQAMVTGAASHGGGWDQVVIQKVCSQAQDPSNYTTCTASAGWIELADLNAFLDWMAAAGQSGGAPANSFVQTVATAINSSDTVLPTTAISCNGSACLSTQYQGTVYVSLLATDSGAGVSVTRYTTDGTDPDVSSTVYSGPFPLTAPATVKYRSWDNAGNLEAVQAQAVDLVETTDTTPPSTTISCNGVACLSAPYTAPVTVTLAASDNPGGWGVDKTYYTLDGSTPTTSSTVYSGPLTVKTSATVRYFSTDLAGNAEAGQSKAVAFQTVVSLTFDDGIANQYWVGWQHALQPRNIHGTFYIITGQTGVVESAMTWPELTTLANDGQDIGGHTVDHINLKTTTDYQTKVNEVCNDRTNLVNHGFDPVAFAYPEGAYDATAEQIVQNCGYPTARAAGGIDVNGDGAGPVYAEGIPPKDAYATRTMYDPVANGVSTSLSRMQAAVNSAVANGGGWVPLVFHQICSQTYDPDNYASCIQDYGYTQLDTLNALLDWLGNAGQANGAPAGTVLKTVRQVVTGPDLSPPTTTLLCDGTACQGTTTYAGSTTLSFAPVDVGGSGIQATYYTLDGSTPTTSSTVYSGPFTIAQSTTVKYFSVDKAGNPEAVQTLRVVVAPNADPVVGAAGDIACDPLSPAYNNGDGTDTDCRAKSTGTLLTGMDAVLPIGDDQYECGGLSAFQQSYDKSWGPKLSITHPVPGDKDYATSGGTDCPGTPGAGYYAYFGSRAGDPTKGYYSFNLGRWHVIALNTGPCGDDASFCAAGSAQETWLKADLAANPYNACTLAYYQNPRFVSSASGGDVTYQALWQDLYSGGADVVLNGDSHWYERFAPMNGSGASDPNGTREFIVGTGGAGLDTPGTPLATSQVLNATTHGVIKLTLHANGYDWSFLHDSDGTFTDSGSASCHGGDTTPPTTTVTCNAAACATWYTAPVTVALAATENNGGSGLDKTYYTIDGSTPTTSSTVYSGQFTVTGTTTVKYFSTDKAGNAEAVKTQVVQIDGGPPTTTAACNGTACSTGWYTATVSVSLSATDSGTSGVNKIYYTTNGTTPTTSSPAYTAPFNVSTTTTVKFFATDKAGNAEAVKTQVVQVDTAKPVTTVSCNGSACSTGWYRTAPVTVALSATDSGSAGLDKTYYTTDGSTPTTSSTIYSGQFTVTGTTTVKYFSTDRAGNAETVKTQLIQIDTTAPTVSITQPASGSSVTRGTTVTIVASASDSGSGIAKVDFFDGSTKIGTATTSPYQFAWNTGTATLGTHTLTAVATDTAGNTKTSTAVTVTVQ
jgi:peptidoglycan/xylan/chitin deacetylase (PgdA/CDA1 family)